MHIIKKFINNSTILFLRIIQQTQIDKLCTVIFHKETRIPETLGSFKTLETRPD